MCAMKSMQRAITMQSFTLTAIIAEKKHTLISHFAMKTFVSDHITDYIMLYSVQLKNMYSYLKSSLKLSDIVRGLSSQQSYCNLLSLYKFIIIIPLFYLTNFYSFHPHHV